MGETAVLRDDGKPRLFQTCCKRPAWSSVVRGVPAAHKYSPRDTVSSARGKNRLLFAAKQTFLRNPFAVPFADHYCYCSPTSPPGRYRPLPAPKSTRPLKIRPAIYCLLVTVVVVVQVVMPGGRVLFAAAYTTYAYLVITAGEFSKRSRRCNR